MLQDVVVIEDLVIVGLVAGCVEWNPLSSIAVRIAVAYQRKLTRDICLLLPINAPELDWLAVVIMYVPINVNCKLNLLMGCGANSVWVHD